MKIFKIALVAFYHLVHRLDLFLARHVEEIAYNERGISHSIPKQLLDAAKDKSLKTIKPVGLIGWFVETKPEENK
jgi:hypothetical protein